MSLADKIRKQKLAKENDNKEKLAEAVKSKQKAVKEKASKLASRVQSKASSVVEDVQEAAEELTEDVKAELEEKATDAKDRYSDLVERVQMTNIVRDIASLGNRIEKLPEDIDELRRRGYTFRAYLEGSVEVLAEQWDDVSDQIEAWLEEEASELEDDMAKAMGYQEYLEPVTRLTETVLPKFNAILDHLDAQLGASEARIKALYDEIQREVSRMNHQISKISQQLDWLEASNVTLNSGEGLYVAAEAEWRDDRDKPDGFLFVTNQRMIFEQNEKTGGMLGFGGKQTQEILWETPLSSVEKVIPEDKGMMGGEDMMHLKLGAGAPYAEITCEIKGGIDSKDWAQQVNRAVKGLITQESTEEPDPELIERLQNAPTACPNCGAMLPKIDAGTTEVTCKYCGNVVRV